MTPHEERQVQKAGDDLELAQAIKRLVDNGVISLVGGYGGSACAVRVNVPAAAAKENIK